MIIIRIIFTYHAEERLKKRNIQKEDAMLTIKYPDNILKKYGKYYFQKEIGLGKIEGVCVKAENILNIATLYWLEKWK
ncbi:MAG: DUF4258 domain-containing protein [Candidatus Woesearchaeota archaeon]